MNSPPFSYSAFVRDKKSYSLMLCPVGFVINSALVLMHTKVLLKVLDYEYVFVHIQY